VEYCGMARTEEGLTKAKGLIQALRADFWKTPSLSVKTTKLTRHSKEPAALPTFGAGRAYG